jgi:hypothetical protein
LIHMRFDVPLYPYLPPLRGFESLRLRQSIEAPE